MGKLRANSEIISDKSKNPVTTSTYIKHGNQWLDDAVNNAIGAAASKADKTYVDSELTKKANKSDTDAALSSKADKSALEAINASVSANTSNIQELSTESTVLSARMDTFTKLSEGSTTGDAELADGRVGADGKTYDNIGGAIRGQVTDLKSDLNNEVLARNNAISNAVNNEKQRAISEEQRIESLFTLPTQDAVNKWLDEHPEATTTVQDHSLTIDKMVVGTIGYVTPEMFGAVGDGVTDDGTAFVELFNANKPILLVDNKTYFIGQITVENNIEMLGNNSVTLKGTLTINGESVIDGVNFVHAGESNFTLQVHAKTHIRNCCSECVDTVPQSLINLATADGSVIESCHIKNNKSGRLGIGVASSSNVIIKDCIIEYIGGSGIEIFDVCNNVTIENNVIYNCNFDNWSGSGASDGCISTYGDTTGTGTTPSKNLVIRNNKIINDIENPKVKPYGMRLNGVQDCIVEGNFFYAYKSTQLFVQNRKHGEYIVYNKNIVVDNNVFVLIGSGTPIYLFTVDDITIKNNKIYYLNGEEAVHIQIGQESAPTAIPSNVKIFDNELIENGCSGYSYGINSVNFDDLYIKDNYISCIRGINLENSNGNGRTWIISNIIRNTGHVYIINCKTNVKCFIKDNIHSYLTTTGTIKVTDANVVYNDGNIPDNEMN